MLGTVVKHWGCGSELNSKNSCLMDFNFWSSSPLFIVVDLSDSINSFSFFFYSMIQNFRTQLKEDVHTHTYMTVFVLAFILL